MFFVLPLQASDLAARMREALPRLKQEGDSVLRAVFFVLPQSVGGSGTAAAGSRSACQPTSRAVDFRRASAKPLNGYRFEGLEKGRPICAQRVMPSKRPRLISMMKYESFQLLNE